MLKGMYVINAEPIYKNSFIAEVLGSVALFMAIVCVLVVIWKYTIKQKVLTNKAFHKIVIVDLCALIIAVFSSMPFSFLRYIDDYKYYCTFDNNVTIGTIKEYFTILGEEDGVYILKEK